jgi:Glycosyl hydrolases family 2, sugar binding domain/Glycosyl hydrolases family 2
MIARAVAGQLSTPSLRRAPLCALLLLLIVASAHAQTSKLESGWQFLADREGTLKVSDLNRAQGWRDVRVGLSWNAQFADLRDYMGVAWYRTNVNVPDLSNGRRALLRFGACDYFSEVFVNGRSIGTHEGGYTPFTFDITDALHAGANELAVRVIDPPMDEREGRARFPTMLYNEIPHGKQNWYVQTGGLWQPVWLESRPSTYIKRVQVTTQLSGRVAVDVQLENGSGFSGMMNQGLSVTIRSPAGQIEFTKTIRARDLQGGEFTATLKTPQLWDLTHPVLYEVEAALGDEQKDIVRERFGFRTFEARDGKFYLNGEPFYMRAALDQDFYPETIYTPPSKEYVKAQMLKGKQIGLNLLRCHIKVCDPTYLEAADEVGMLVWYEIPSWNDEHHFAQVAAARGEQVFKEMVARDWNHPAIVIQSIINEGWGADVAHQAESRAWLRAEFDRAKTLTAPLGRLIVDNSACCDNFHLKTDIADNHRYNSIPDEYQPFDEWVADFAARPKWNFSPFGDAEPTGREPLVVSEFGNWGLPHLPKDLPWWFERGFGNRPITRPAGLSARFDEFKFGTLFHDYDALADATEWHQFVSLKHEIEEIRRHASIQGYVITEFTDINWEANGLLSMWREPKAYAAELAKIQQDDLVIARLPKYNFTSGERVEIETRLSHYKLGRPSGAGTVALKWSTSWGEQGSSSTTLKTDRGSVDSLKPISLIMPDVKQPQRMMLSLNVTGIDGQRIAENSAEFFVYPKPAPAAHTPLVFYDPQHALGLKPEQLTAAGYSILTAWIAPAKTDRAPLLISSVVDEKVARHLRSGGRALILANTASALPANAPFKITPRAGSDLDGNWITNFNWVRDGAPSPFSRVAFTKILGFESERVVPRVVLQHVPAANYTDVLAGIFYGWLNENQALAVQMRVGAGRMLLTTFRFDEYGRDPYATQLLDALIAYTDGPDCAPKLNYEMRGAMH